MRAGILERHGVVVGIILLCAVAALMYWMRNQIILDRLEYSIRTSFVEFYKFAQPLTLTSVKLAGPKGEEVDLREFRGKYLVLNVWATWCTPCVKELPELERLRRHYIQGKWNVIAVSSDSSSDVDKIMQFIEQYKLGEVAEYHDYAYELQKALPIRKLPVTFIINKRGRVVYEIRGAAAWSSPDIVEFLDYVAKVK